MLNYSNTLEESKLSAAIGARASKLADSCQLDYPYQVAFMDIDVCHANGCPLDLAGLLAAPDGDFAHDVFGIRRHLNRNTGALGGCFSPRYSLRTPAPRRMTCIGGRYYPETPATI